MLSNPSAGCQLPAEVWVAYRPKTSQQCVRKGRKTEHHKKPAVEQHLG
jgi:hypothetical protein